jgi:hypothetical protein
MKKGGLANSATSPTEGGNQYLKRGLANSATSPTEGGNQYPSPINPNIKTKPLNVLGSAFNIACPLKHLNGLNVALTLNVYP